MRLGLLALVALFVGALAAHFLLGDQGYVLIRFRGYVIEMSVPALFMLFVLGYVVARLLKRLWRAPRAFGEALAGRGDRKAGDRLTRGLIHMTDGDFRRSERLLTQGLKNSAAPLVNYLMAARAAHEQGARERRNEWLKLACESLPEAEVTVLLTQAEMQRDDGELEQALATLQRVHDKEPDHRAGLTLLAETLIDVGDRARLIELVPHLVRAKVAPEALATIVPAAFEAASAPADANYENYARLWSGLPNAVKQNPIALRAHALALNRLGRGDQAATELAAALKRNWDADLVRTYGEVQGTDSLKQLRKAEDWLKAHPDDAGLLMTAARLCMHNELWGKARSYLESSIALAPTPDAYALYGDLLERLGEREQAALAYHSGLSLAGKPGLSLPALTAPTTARRA